MNQDQREFLVRTLWITALATAVAGGWTLRRFLPDYGLPRGFGLLFASGITAVAAHFLRLGDAIVSAKLRLSIRVATVAAVLISAALAWERVVAEAREQAHWDGLEQVYAPGYELGAQVRAERSQEVARLETCLAEKGPCKREQIEALKAEIARDDEVADFLVRQRARDRHRSRDCRCGLIDQDPRCDEDCRRVDEP